MEKIAGLNFRGLQLTKFFAEILSCFLSQKLLLLKRGPHIYRIVQALPLILNHNNNNNNLQKNFCSALENCKNLERLAQRIFPLLRYS